MAHEQTVTGLESSPLQSSHSAPSRQKRSGRCRSRILCRRQASCPCTNGPVGALAVGRYRTGIGDTIFIGVYPWHLFRLPEGNAKVIRKPPVCTANWHMSRRRRAQKGHRLRGVRRGRQTDCRRDQSAIHRGRFLISPPLTFPASSLRRAALLAVTQHRGPLIENLVRAERRVLMLPLSWDGCPRQAVLRNRQARRAKHRRGRLASICQKANKSCQPFMSWRQP
jgi:hypothetical protein